MNSVQFILNKFPSVQTKLRDPKNPEIFLTTQESVFYQLIQFFKNPETIQININMLYEHLNDEDLLIALESLIIFFQKDTTLISNVEQSFYNSHLLKEKILGQTGFAKMVEEEIEGIKFRPTMLHTYRKRKSKRIPQADIIIEGTPYWKVSEVEQFIKEERERRNKDQ